MDAQRRTPWRGLWFVLFAVAFGTNVPSPLLLVYRERMGLSATVLTAIFGVYAAGLLPALLLAGPASDRLGRRRVALPFVVLSAVASALFIAAASSVPLLFLGRFLQGAVSGVVFSVGSAWLTELIGPSAAGLAARRATVALSAGWALGPLSAGLLGQWAPAPTTVPYLLHLALMAAALAAAVVVPETLVQRRAKGPLINLGIPPGAGRAFAWFVVPAGVFVFTFPSLSITVLPLFLQRTMTGIDVAVTGVVAGLTMLTGVVVQPLGKRLGEATAAPVGGALGAGGLGLSLLADTLQAWPLLIPVAMLLGAGYGLCLAAGLTAAEHLAAPEARGALTASFYAVAYLGFAAPVLVSAATRGGDFSGPLAVVAAGSAALALLLFAGPGRRALRAHHVPDEPDVVPVV
jgi:predicted MFS family arabinose efflux permease